MDRTECAAWTLFAVGVVILVVSVAVAAVAPGLVPDQPVPLAVDYGTGPRAVP